ncbi:MAG: methionyl-tRNA formyltransferase [Candidatus Nomurabacteria bacterium]|jgi:methionyl-tRNA formyltransferase|nr:methionyl-tRNA formyltransferase [Candidatus Nomurabacteria bacterium]
MSSSKLVKIIFFGNEQLAQGLEKPATPIFDALVASGCEIAALVLPRRAEPRSRRAKKLAVIDAAERLSVPIIYADEERDLDKTLRQFGAEIGVLASFGMIVKKSTIDLFPRGIVNIHPSLLPKYRGSSPIETAIAEGARETGVSLMALGERMDAGAVYTQEKIALTGDESKQELYEKLAACGAQMLVKNLDEIIAGQLTPTPQDESAATYSRLLTKADGTLDQTTMTASECERKIRAFAGFPRTRLVFMGREVIVTKAHVETISQHPYGVLCVDCKWLVVDELVAPTSGKTMPIADYLRGLR